MPWDNQQPSQNSPKFEQLFTANDFTQFANETEINSRQRHREQEKEHEGIRKRKRDLANFRRTLNQPP